MRASIFLALFTLVLGAKGAFAQTRPDVGFVGLYSADLDAQELAAAEAAFERQLERKVRIRGKSSMNAALIEREDIARSLSGARKAAAAGDAALDAFDLARALDQFGAAMSGYDDARGQLLVPGEIAHVLERRAQALYALRRPAEMRREFARLALVQPVKALDARVFAPDAVAAYAEELAALRAADPLSLPVDALAEIARSTGVRWVAAAQVRRTEGFADFHVSLVSSTGTLWTRDIHAPREAIGESLERGLAAVLDGASVPRREVVAIPTPTPAPRRDRKTAAAPIYRRWYFWGGVVLAGAAAAYALAPEPGADGKNDPGPEPGDPGVTIVFDDP